MEMCLRSYKNISCGDKEMEEKKKHLLQSYENMCTLNQSLGMCANCTNEPLSESFMWQLLNPAVLLGHCLDSYSFHDYEPYVIFYICIISMPH